MGLTSIVWTIAIFLSLMFIGIAYRVRGKATSSFSDFAIAGGALPLLFVFFADITSILGVGNFVGHAAKGYQIGMANIPFVLGEQGSKIIFALLFAGFAGRFAYITIAELMDDLLIRDKVSRVLIGFLTLCIMIAWVAGQAKGLSDVFATFTKADPMLIILLFAAVFTIYTCLGGIHSVIWVDLLQGVMVLSLALFFYYNALAPVHWNFNELTMKLQAVGAGSLAHMNLSWSEVLTKFITGSFGMLAAQVYWQRCFAAKDSRTARQAMLFGGIIAVIFVSLTTLVGIVAKTLNPNIPANEAMPWMVMNTMPLVVTTFIFTLIFVAAMSSSSGLAISAASIFTNDLIKPFCPKASEKQLIKWTRVSIIAIGVFAAITALWAKSVIDLFSMAYTMAGGGVVPVLLVGLLWKRFPKMAFTMGIQNSRISPWGARIGIISGAIISISFGILWGTLISCILTIAVSLMVPSSEQNSNPEFDQLENFN